MKGARIPGIVLFIGPLLARGIVVLGGKPREGEKVELVESA